MDPTSKRKHIIYLYSLKENEEINKGERNIVHRPIKHFNHTEIFESPSVCLFVL